MAWQEPFISKSIFMKKIILFISLPILLALLNVLCYLLLQPPKTKEGRESVYSFLPGKMLAIKDNLTQRRLLEKTDQGYRVQEFYGVYPATAPFIIKNKEDLTKGIGYIHSDMGDRFDTIGSVEGEITLYYQVNRALWVDSWIVKDQQTGFARIEPYIRFQWLKLWKKPYQQTLPIKLKLTYQAGKRQGQWAFFYENGQQRTIANYQEGLLEGTSTSWDNNGQKLQEINFKSGLLDGTYTNWNPSGAILISGTYQADQKQGQWNYWLTDGRQQKIQTYQQGKLINDTNTNAFEEPVRISEPSRCGILNNKIIKIGFSEGVLYNSVSSNKKQDDCSRQIDHVQIKTDEGDSQNPLSFQLYTASPDHLGKLRDEAFSKLPMKSQYAVKDPVTGFWTMPQMSKTINRDSSYYWMEDNGKVIYFIQCSRWIDFCHFYTNMSEYNAELIVSSISNSFLLQYSVEKERAMSFMQAHTLNNLK